MRYTFLYKRSKIEAYIYCFFFFSSRRRHTRLQGDWSSDVCSSDLSFGGAWAKSAHQVVRQRGNAGAREISNAYDDQGTNCRCAVTARALMRGSKLPHLS